MTKGTCPVCHGSCRRAYTGDTRYASVVATYDAATNTVACDNCGNQYMYSSAKGEVNLNRDGVPCTHVYTGENAGRCLTTYTCRHCGDRYQIDSGD